jgi:hypothetical protein
VQARQQLKEMVWIKSSENMVLEAMYRLSGLHDALEDLLRGNMHQNCTHHQSRGTPSAEDRGKGKWSPPESPLGGQQPAAQPKEAPAYEPEGSSGAGQPSRGGRVLEAVARLNPNPPGPSNAHLAGKCLPDPPTIEMSMNFRYLFGVTSLLICITVA